MNKLEQKILTFIENAKLEPTEYNTVLTEGDLNFNYNGFNYGVDLNFDYDLQKIELTIWEDEKEIKVSETLVDKLFEYLEFLCESAIQMHKLNYISHMEDLDHQFHHFGYGKQ